MTAKDGKPCKQCGATDWNKHGWCRNCDKLRHRKRRAENPEHARRLGRDWKRKNKASHIRSSMKWTRKNREKQRGYIRKWNQNHRQERLAAARRRLEAKKEAESEPYNFKEICNFYGNRCLCCGRDDVELTIDHVIPISWGGPDTPDNIQPLCAECNCKKNAYRATDYRKNRFEYWKQLKLDIGE